jgi:chromosome segregation ATPase
VTAIDAIESAQTNVLDRLATHTSLRQAFQKERKLRADCSDAYQKLHSKYGQQFTDLQNMSTQCHSLNQQLNGAQGTISDLEWKIGNLEKDREEAIQEHQNELASATDVINSTQQRINKLEKDRDHMMREHQSAMTDAADRTTIAEQKMRELEEKCSILEAHKLSESAEQNPLSRSKKRQSPENESETSSHGPTTRGRKRRYVAMLKGADTIEVSV